jgi:hypothetical protein
LFETRIRASRVFFVIVVWTARKCAFASGSGFVYEETVAAGSYLTEDPARQGSNPYAYVGWNPVKFIDPTGMMLIPTMAFTFNLYASRGMADLYKGRHGLTDIGIGTGGGTGGAGGLALEMQAGMMNGQRYTLGRVLLATGAASTNPSVAFAATFGSATWL